MFFLVFVLLSGDMGEREWKGRDGGRAPWLNNMTPEREYEAFWLARGLWEPPWVHETTPGGGPKSRIWTALALSNTMNMYFSLTGQTKTQPQFPVWEGGSQTPASALPSAFPN